MIKSTPWRRPLSAGTVAALGLLAACATQAQQRNSAQYASYVAYDLQACTALNCNCPGCRAYVDACQAPYCDSPWPPDMGYGGAPGYEGPQPIPGQEGAPSESAGLPSPGAAGQGAPPATLAGVTGATAAALSATPNQIGDLFGVSSGTSVAMLDRLFVIGQDIDATVTSPAGSPFTASESPSSVVVAEGYAFSGAVVAPTNVVSIQPADAEFTTAVTTAEMQAALNADPDANIPIVDNGTYQTLADNDFVTRNGGTGTTQFNAGESFAHLQDDALPMGGPGVGEDYDVVYAYDYVVDVPIDALGGAPGANVGRQKISENGSPIPRDRFIDSFSYFDNTALFGLGQNVTRNVVGIEKTFCDEMISLEFRAPYAATLNNNLTLGSSGVVGGTSSEFGNMVLYGKLLLWEDDWYAIGAGMGITMPTADDVVLRDAVGVEVLRVENESPHLMPYVGLVCAPSDQLFWQGVLQFDIDSQGNGVSVSPFVDGAYTGELQFADRLRDKDLVYVDFSVGYWCYQTRRPTFCVTGFAPMFELHYNGAIDRGDALITDTFRSTGFSSFDLLNAVAGAVVQFGGNVNMNLAYVTPVAGDEQFDGEFRMSLNWYFGPSAQRFARNPF